MRSQNGNVLFLILIAVALFAALSYAVTSSTRSGGGTISKEKAEANAAAIIQFGTTLRSAVMRVKLSNGCTDFTLSFVNSIFQKNDGSPSNSNNANAPADKKCNIFDAAGGGIVPVTAPAAALDFDSPGLAPGNGKPGHGGVRVSQFTGIGTDGPAGTVSANDIYFTSSWLNRETCLAVNDILGVANPGGEPPAFSWPNSGGANLALLNSTGVVDVAEVNGKPAFCRLDTSESNYQFIQILVER